MQCDKLSQAPALTLDPWTVIRNKALLLYVGFFFKRVLITETNKNNWDIYTYDVRGRIHDVVLCFPYMFTYMHMHLYIHAHIDKYENN